MSSMPSGSSSWRRRDTSTSSTGKSDRLSFGGSIRLGDLVDDGDEYGFDNTEPFVEPALDVVEMRSEDLVDREGSDTDSNAAVERASVGSNESREQSRLVALFDKAKSKGKKLVHHKSKKELIDCAAQCSLEQEEEEREDEQEQKRRRRRKKDASSTHDDDEGDVTLYRSLARKCANLPFFHHRMIFLGALIAVTMVSPGFVTGILWGLYVSFVGFLYIFVSDPQPPKQQRSEFCRDASDSPSRHVEMNEADEVADEVTEGRGGGVGDGIVYRGWMNELRGRYSPANYHVNAAQSVLVRLEGGTLRISRPARSVLKHAFHSDPTLTQPAPTMTSQTIYDLKNAVVNLRPRRLARRRWWSRKYPIHIKLPHAGSTLVETDRRSMTRSVSMHPTNSPDVDTPLSTLSERTPPLDEGGYEGETDSSEGEENDPLQARSRTVLGRANSTSDLSEFQKGEVAAKRKGRSVYLFVRAAREKERWFHLLREACARARHSSVRRSLAQRQSSLPAWCGDVDGEGEGGGGGGGSDQKCTTSSSSDKRPRSDREMEHWLYTCNHVQFTKLMLGIVGHVRGGAELGDTASVDLGAHKWRPQQLAEGGADLVASVHAIATRIFFDFCRDEYWARQIKEKIQTKLATIHLPYFIEQLSLSELDVGTATPQICGVYAPQVDEWGLWVDFEMKYRGCIRLTLETRVNLLKLQSGAQQVENEKKVSRWTESVRMAHYSDEDLPESPESSPDEDFGAKNNENQTQKERTGKKLLSMVERAAQSSFFQKAARISKVAKVMEDISSTRLMLNVEISVLEGTMTVNLPPPPSDRIWYAFRKVPEVSIRAVPQVGDRSVDMTTVSDWIESKMKLLIEKNLVCPNMDDVTLPAMSGNELLHMGYNR